MPTVLETINAKYKKSQVVDVRSGDTVRVHQKIKEGNKERIQIFEGLVIRTDRKNSHTSSVTVSRVASGIGVEKTYLLHSPLVTKIEVTKRSKVRRNYLSYMRKLTGKSARLSSVDFDKEKVNTVHDAKAEAEEAKLKAEAEAKHEEAVKEKAEEAAKEEAKAEKALAQHEAAAEQKPEDKKD